MVMIINGKIEKDPPEVTPDLSPTAVSDNDGLVEKSLDADDTDDVKILEGDPDDCPDEDPPEGSPLKDPRSHNVRQRVPSWNQGHRLES